MPQTLPLFPCPSEDTDSCDASNGSEVVVHRRKPRTLRLFPLEPGDLQPPRRYNPYDVDVWRIKKRLTASDVTCQARFLILKEDVNHILNHLTEEEIRLVEDENNEGLMITAYDNDSRTSHQLCFKRWNSTGSYILNDNWSKDFVQRRNLQEGDEIGLFWNCCLSRLHFKVIARVNL